MNDRTLTAKALRDQNLKYSAIGAALGVSRQRAYAMVRQAENLEAFRNVNDLEPPRANGDLLANPTAPYEGSVPLTVEGTRMAYDDTPAGRWSFERLAAVIEQLRKGYDPKTYYALAEEMLERDSNLRSLIDIRVAQTAHQALLPDLSNSTLARDKKRAQEGIDMLIAAGFKEVMPDILAARHNSVCILELEWELTPTARTIKAVHWRDPKGFIFDRQDYRKLYIKPDTPGGKVVPAPAGRFVVVFANGKPGAPVRSGLALPASWEYVKKSIAELDWTRYINRYGKPAPALNVPADIKMTPKEEDDLRRLAFQLGSTDTVAILKNGTTITYSKDGTVQGSSDAHESKVRYHDEQVTKLYLGGSLASGTGNTGSGGSQALGTVHGALRYDLQKADAPMLESAANEALHWWAILNGGQDAFVPKVRLELDKPEDKAAARENAKVAHELGLPLSISKTAQQLGVHLAESEDDTLRAPSAPQPTKAGEALSAVIRGNPCPAHDPATFAKGPKRDAIDDLADEMLAEYEQVTADVDQLLADAVLNAGSLEQAVNALKKVIGSADLAALEALFTTKGTATRAAGHLGGEV